MKITYLPVNQAWVLQLGENTVPVAGQSLWESKSDLLNALGFESEAAFQANLHRDEEI